MNLEETLAKTLIDLDRYQILAAVERAGKWIIVQESEHEQKRYCLQYAGGGRYFDTLEELNAYSWKRWQLKFTLCGGVIDGKAEQ